MKAQLDLLTRLRLAGAVAPILRDRNIAAGAAKRDRLQAVTRDLAAQPTPVIDLDRVEKALGLRASSRGS